MSCNFKVVCVFGINFQCRENQTGIIRHVRDGAGYEYSYRDLHSIKNCEKVFRYLLQ